MTCFNISLTTVLLRFYLMMAIVIVAGFSGMWWLSVLALPVFISNMIGLKLWPVQKSASQRTKANQNTLKPSTQEMKMAA
ncbi:MAG: hypothetical protein AAGF87_14285 [Bacteroidota bacterium]